MTRVAVNGIFLNVETGGDGPPLLLLHGFTGDTTTWEPFLDAWSGFRTVRVDLIGHGRSDSPADAARYSMHHAVQDLLALLHHLEIERPALLGYSLGGRVALHLATEAPETLTALVLESASPGIPDAGGRKARRDSDAALADEIARDGLEAFVDRWQAQPLFASQSRLPAETLERERRRRLAQSPLGLANSLRGMGAGSQEYLLPRLAHVDVPALFLAGALDQRYAALAPQMAAAAPNASHHVFDDAGHAVHLEQPGAFEHVVTAFLRTHAHSTCA